MASGDPDAWLMGGKDGMVRDGPDEVGSLDRLEGWSMDGPRKGVRGH